MRCEKNEYVSYITDLMQTIGPVTAKRMFGGHGIFLEGLMFGIVVDDVLYFKADRDTKNLYSKRGLEAFKYCKQGKEITLSYYQAPEEVFDNIDDMKFWANMAYDTAVRVSSKI